MSQPGQRVSPTIRIALGFMILVACLLAASTWRVYSNTWDEPEHLAAGIELLDKGRYEYDTEHPPIVRIFMALGPYLAGARSFGTPPPDGVLEGVDILYSGGHYELYLTLARLGTLPFLALLLYSTWLWARRVSTSAGEALLAVLLTAAVPPILGHAALATLDVAAAATVLLALYAAQCWLSSGRWKDAVFVGLASGLAVGSKFSAVPFLALGFGVQVVAHAVLLRRQVRPPSGGLASAASMATGSGGAPAPERPPAPAASPVKQRLRDLAIILVMTLLPLALAYGVRSHATSVAHRFDWALAFLLREHGLSHDAGVLLQHLWMPQWVQGLLEGIIAIKAHNDAGHLSFLLGQLRLTGWWYFYLVALAVKTPIPLLVLGPVGMVMLAREGWRERDAWRLAPLLLFLAVLVFASGFSHINIGIRHVLVLYPFMALGAAYLVARVWRALRAAAVRPVAIACSGLVVAFVGWQVLTLWTANPDYLPYFNEAVAHPEQVLVDSDLDWGQDLQRLEERAAVIKIPKLNLAYLGTPDLTRERLPPYVIMTPGKPVTGWIAISALVKAHYPKGYAWLNAYQPLETIGKTIQLYYIPPAR
jgi:Dolichyl-phosphate-mannose-protein mannosyltransferase